MKRNSRVKPIKIEPSSKRIRPTSVDEDMKVSFNFRCLQASEKFNYKNRGQNYFQALVQRLRDISSMSRREMTIYNSDGLRCHRIKFNDKNVTEDSFGIPNLEELDDEAWQFHLSTNEHGRVHGYFIGNIFSIVWLDPKHNLYKRK